MNTVNNWQPMETAPKDRPVLLDVGAEFPVFGIFKC